MIKVLLIIPYKELEEPVYQLLNGIHHDGVTIETTHIFGTSRSGIEEKQPDIIVARGMTCAALRKNFPDKHMVEISMTSFDILSALAKAKELYHPKKAAVCVGRFLVPDLDYFKQLAGFDVETYSISDETDIEKSIQGGLAEGVEVFIGGLTLCQQCRARQIPCIHIKTSRNALQAAIDESVATAVTLNQERAKTVLFQSLLNHIPDAILAVDHHGNITALNSNAYKMRRFPTAKPLVGKKIEHYWKGIDWKSAMKSGKSCETLLEAYGAIYYTRCSPIYSEGNIIGALINIQTANTIQNAESKIRKELSSKGLTAKYSFDDIVGISDAMKKSISIAVKYAQVDANVMLVGETGTGKELFAHSVHMASKRRDEPFVAVNCAALPEALLESELFGYVEGAFSGAVKGGKIGLFELAHNGTIFLDEIGEMPISIQAKLLRVLQEKEIRRLGDDRVHLVNVRVISATNIDIQEQIANKQFRSDLYYRLNLLGLQLVPLRERKEDIPVMIDYFMQIFSKQYKRGKPSMTKNALAQLEAYQWPGNSREMRNFCEKLMVLNESDLVDTTQLGVLGIVPEQDVPQDGNGKPLSKAEVLALMKERSMTNEELAKQLGISRTTLWRWSREAGS